MVPHTAFPKCITSATKATTNTTTRVHVTIAVIGTRHQSQYFLVDSFLKCVEVNLGKKLGLLRLQ